jgi:dephospho-CoA kinase
MNKIFAVVGMCGSGKSVACDVLVELGWNYIRFGRITMEKLMEEGLEINAQNERMMRERLRKDYGMAAYAVLSQEKIEEAAKTGNVVIDGLYSWSEYRILKEKYGNNIKIIHIYASPDTRYSRLEKREHNDDDKTHRMRKFTREEAVKRDFSEIENLEKGGPIAMADYTFINEGPLANIKTELKKLANS